MFVKLLREQGERALEKPEQDFMEKHRSECYECQVREIPGAAATVSTNVDPRAEVNERISSNAILDHLTPKPKTQ